MSRCSARGSSTRGSWSRRGTVLCTFRQHRPSLPHPARGGKPSASSCRLGCLRCKSPRPSSRPSGRTDSTSSRTRKGKTPFARGWKTSSGNVARRLRGHDKDGSQGPVADPSSCREGLRSTAPGRAGSERHPVPDRLQPPMVLHSVFGRLVRLSDHQRVDPDRLRCRRTTEATSGSICFGVVGPTRAAQRPPSRGGSCCSTARSECEGRPLVIPKVW